jgi:endonuclease/exonuclease/phosphatase family metal-dependent hydrolase
VGSRKNQIRVLSRNLYLGADLEPVAEAALSGDEQGVVTKATEFWNQVQASDFSTRAGALASEISLKQPHLVGLQEVSLYRTGQSITEEATDVQLDFLQILLDALAEKGAEYKAVSVHQAFDGQLPALSNEGELGAVRLTDRDVILMRTDLPAKSFKLAKSKSGAYEAQLDLVTGLDVSRGWTSADVKFNGERIRFVNSHLETSSAPSVQKQQARELINGAAKSKKWTLLVGDFNSDAENPESATYGTYDVLTGKKLVDTWTTLKPNASFKKSVTYGVNDDLRLTPYSVNPERLDLVLFGAGFTPKTISRFISPVESAQPLGPLWNSDHGGISADFTLA